MIYKKFIISTEKKHVKGFLQSGGKQKPYTQSETKYKEIGGETIVYFVNSDGKNSGVVVPGIKRSETDDESKSIQIELIEKGSKLELKVRENLEREGTVSFW